MWVDGERGEVLLAPDASQTTAFTDSRGRYDRVLSRLTSEEGERCATLDGHAVTLLGNIGRPSEVEAVHEHHLRGVGLFRTEYLFLDAAERPSVDFQRELYRGVLSGLRGQPLVVRTFDFGGDKCPLFLARAPSTGLRGLSFSLDEGVLLREQIRAVIEAAAPEHEVSLLLPMVSSAADMERALELVEQVASSLRRRRPRLGAMIETPSAVFELDEILRVADFASVGTNDLTQFMLGLDRTSAGALGDEGVFQPAMLRALRRIAECGAAHGRSITVCGEAAGHPVAALVLVGLGFRSLSMSPVRAAQVRSAIRRSHASRLAELSSQALRLSTRAQVIEHVGAAVREWSGEASLAS